MTEWERMSQLPDFKLRVDACRLGLPFDVAMSAPSDFIWAYIAATK